MFTFETKDLETPLAGNYTIHKKVEIDTDLDCFIIIDSNNQKILTPVINKIVDLILDNVSHKDTYAKFSITLESINFFIKNLKNKEDNIEKLNILIGVLEYGNFHFAKIGHMHSYLLNNNNECIEISDPKAYNLVFDYISSGKLLSGNSIIISNLSFFDTMTNSDIEELAKLKTPESINENIKHLFEEEKIEHNICVTTIAYHDERETQHTNKYLQNAKNIFYKALDNDVSKRVIASGMILKEALDKKGKIVKNAIFIGGILLSSILLYYSIAGLVGQSIQNSKDAEYKNELIKAREFIRAATENIANPEAFDLNVKKAEEILTTVKNEKMFLTDIENIQNDLSIIKKEFNGIEIFEANSNNIIFRGNFQNPQKILELNKKLYVLSKNSIYGPIVSGKDIKNNVFEELESDDQFIDASASNDDIIVVTKKSRVVKFTKDGKFNYIAVVGQDSWQNSAFIESYNGNLYLTNKESTQVFKHSPSLGSFTSGVPYLKDEDAKNIGKILSIGIDGGIYILKQDLKILKLFTSPKYKLESLVLNKLPKNYNYESGETKLIVKPNLNFVYMYLNNKVWIFEPNTRNSSDTKSLQYIGQIEGKNEVIKGMYIPRDGEVNVLTDNGIYKINFEISKDGKLILR